jgi:mannosidase alpha-like ER degradation enhancer 2
VRFVSIAITIMLAGGAAGCASAPASPRPRADDDAPARAAEVRREVQHAWAGYKRYAWGHDELLPLSRAGRDWHPVSLLMTPVDALDTLILLHLDAEANEARQLIDTRLSFDQDVSVKTFEITIRLLGGLLSGYQLTGDQRLLELASDLGRRLAPAFASATGMPYTYVNLRTGAVSGPRSNPAEIGTLILEFGTLAKLTHQPRYYDLAKRALQGLWQRRSPLGLVGDEIDVETGKWTDPVAHISGGIDSYYEYLVKGARLFDDAELGTMAREMLGAVDKYLADETADGLWYGYADMNSGKRTETVFGALDAFYPAVLVLAGDVPRAARLQESAFRMWRVAGLEPEVYDYRKQTITSGGYQLRPEIIESAFYLYRRTHEPRYREMGRVFLRDLEMHCRTDDGYAAISDVRTMEKRDRMESYFLAETMKYLYLLFAPEDALALEQVTINTEAHPLRRTW